MRELGVPHDSFTFPLVNRAVLLLKCDVLFAELVHCVAVKLGFGFDLFFCNTMIEVYSKYRCIHCACKVFDEMWQRDLVSWTSMISGYVFEGNVASAFELFNKMRLELEPNSVTVIALLQGCSHDSSIGGRQLHSYVIKCGLLIDCSVQNSILRMYSKMGSVEKVEALFAEMVNRDNVSWNTLINFYSVRKDGKNVVQSFNKMRNEAILSNVALTSVVSMFAKVGNLMEGEKLHAFSIKVGLCDDILLTSLMDLYAKWGELRNSAQLFREIPWRNIITWNAMMSGYIQNGYFHKSIELFHEMQAADIKPGAEILGSLVESCSHLGALKLGKGIHGYLLRNLFYETDGDYMPLRTSILNMYIRCGSISLARECFDRMLVKDVVTWTSMIEGYGVHGQGIEALDIFYEMLEEGIAPNSITFLSLLSACSHSGLLNEGCELFFWMKWGFGFEPDVDHYTCLVDILGRHGMLKEALAIIAKMVLLPDSRIWGSLLGASRIHGDRKVGEFAAKRLLEVEPDNVGYCILLSNIRASIGQWAEVEEVRRVIQEKDLKKIPGWSCIEEMGINHCFVSGDRSHKQAEEISEVLGHLTRIVQEFGYV